MSKSLIPAFLLMFLLSLGGCTGNNSNITEPVTQKVEKKDLQVIYYSQKEGYFTVAEFEQQQYAELTSNFSEFISLAGKFPNAVLLIDHNVIQKVDIQRLKDTMGRNERLLLIGYQNPQEEIGLEEYWEKPRKDSVTPLPDRGFCHFILNDGKHADLPETWQKKLPLLQRIDQYNSQKTLDELMTAVVKNKKQYEDGSGQSYNYNWKSSIKNNT